MLSHLKKLDERILKRQNLRGTSMTSTMQGIPLINILDRISKLEFLDEIEELDLVLAHYAISWGLFLEKSDSGTTWGTWGLTQKRE